MRGARAGYLEHPRTDVEAGPDCRYLGACHRERDAAAFLFSECGAAAPRRVETLGSAPSTLSVKEILGNYSPALEIRTKEVPFA